MIREQGVGRMEQIDMDLEYQLHPNTSHIHLYMYG